MSCLFCSNNNCNRGNNCNCNNCNNCQNNCNSQRIILRGPTGPQGPRGPQGPQGATGPAGTNDALYASSGANTVVAGTIIPLTQTAVSPENTSTVTANEVVLADAGSYLVSFFSDGSVTTGDFSTSLYVNDAAYQTETLVQPNSAGAASKTIVYNGVAGDRLSLYNTSADEATITNASITVLKLS